MVKKLPKQIKLQMDTTKSHPGEGGGGMGLQQEWDRKAIVLLGYLGLTLIWFSWQRAKILTQPSTAQGRV